jgi:hypothetical protein
MRLVRCPTVPLCSGSSGDIQDAKPSIMASDQGLPTLSKTSHLRCFSGRHREHRMQLMNPDSKLRSHIGRTKNLYCSELKN